LAANQLGIGKGPYTNVEAAFWPSWPNRPVWAGLPLPGLATKNTEKVRDATTVFAFSVLVVTSTLSPEEVPKMVYLCASEVQFQKCQVGLRQATFCAANLNMYA